MPLAVEPMHPSCAMDWTFMTSLEGALNLAEEYETPALRVAIDTYHFPVESRELPVLRELSRYLAVVHLGDYDEPHGVDQARAPLGTDARHSPESFARSRKRATGAPTTSSSWGLGSALRCMMRCCGSRSARSATWEASRTATPLQPTPTLAARPGYQRLADDPRSEIEFSFARSSGPGGQNVNKVNTKAVLRWRPAESAALPPAVRERLLKRHSGRLSNDGSLVIASDTHREQGRNIGECLQRLRLMVAAAATAPKTRRATKPSRGSKERRLKSKRLNAAKKANRRSRPEDFG